jgi:hypothetical protein
MSMLGAAAWFIYEAGADSIRVESANKVIAATKAAREEEQAKQAKVNKDAKAQYDKINDINNQLNADLDKLRDRPDRGHLPDSSKSICKGTTGEYLSSEDAGFLTREAARADKQRAALESCYKYADTVATSVPPQ